MAMVHRHCCDICGDDGISFHDNAALRQHIAVEHNEHVCVFCGCCFLDESALALHQDRHCTRGFKCMTCDQEFPTLTLCNAHMTTHRMVGGGVSLCSVDGPSQLAYNLTRNRLETDSCRPWESDAAHLWGSGPIQQAISARDRESHGVVTRVEHAHDARVRAELEMHREVMDRIRAIYVNELRHFINHRCVDATGKIVSVRVNFLENRPFFPKLVDALHDIFRANRDQLPYKLFLRFGLLLYKEETNEVIIFFYTLACQARR